MFAEAVDNVTAEFASNPEAYIVTEDSTAGCRCDHPFDVHLMRGACVDSGAHQDGLTRNRYAGALHHDDNQHGPIAIGGEELMNVLHVEKMQCKPRTEMPRSGRYHRKSRAI